MKRKIFPALIIFIFAVAQILTAQSKNDQLVEAIRDNDNIRMIKLLNQGADPNGLNKHGISPLNMAVMKNNLEAAKILVNKGADINLNTKLLGTPIALAAGDEKIELVNFLLSKKADISVRDGEGKTPAELAEELGYERIALLLKDKTK